MGNIKKIWSRTKRFFILKNDYFGPTKYMKRYNRWLRKEGVDLSLDNPPKYIHPSVYFDGIDYRKIHLGGGVVISMNVVLMCHDFSLEAGLVSAGFGDPENESFFLEDIRIGNNTFIGAGAVILGKSKIGDNCIIGAGAVVKGTIPDNSIAVGNPLKIIANTDSWAMAKMKSGIQIFRKNRKSGKISIDKLECEK